MRKLFLISALLLAFPFVASAQDLPKAELFGGYSFIRFEGENLNGWNGSIAGNVNQYLAIVADATGVYKSMSGSVSGVSYTGKISMYDFLFGPRLSSHANKKYTPFAEALFGFAHARGSVTASGNQIINSSGSTNGFSVGLGGGLDLNINPKIALRVAQVDYLLVRASGGTGNGVRILCGLVFRLGGKE